MSRLLHYTKLGQGEPLLILHGLFGSSKNWQSLAKQFAENFTVYSVDLRNHGNSFHDEQMNYEVMAEDLDALIKHLELQSYSIIGHSMGGKIAMLYTLRYRHSISKLVVADIAPVNYQHSHTELIAPILSVDLEQVSSRSQVDKALAPDIKDPMLRGFLLQNLGREGDSWYWKVNWLAIQQHMNALVEFPSGLDDSSIIPALFIRGENSDYIDDQGITAIHQKFGNARIETMNHAGHWLHVEQPQRFVSLVLDFLA
jgi:pimeloyl-ACP methyl ester carboxylesterase